MADLAFEDIIGSYYVVDIKIHNLHTNFNMPHLTYVEQLARFYSDMQSLYSGWRNVVNSQNLTFLLFMRSELSLQ
jgi:hypothetical protein